MQTISIKSVNVYGGTAGAALMADIQIYGSPTVASTNFTFGNVVENAFIPCVGTAAVTSIMTPEQYAAWGTNDDYAVNVFLANAGLERA